MRMPRSGPPAARGRALLILICLALGCAATARPADCAAGDAGFRALVSQFIDAEMRLFPSSATAAGDHRFDAKLADLSVRGIEAMERHATRWKARFAAASPQALSAANRDDRRWLLAYLDGELLWEEEIGFYRRNPGAYLPTAAIDGLIGRNFAPLVRRMKSVTGRERAALANLAAARVNLSPRLVARVSVDIALEQMPATIAFFKTRVPAAFAGLPESPDKQAFLAANTRLVAAIGGYRRWLKGFRARARGNYAIGAAAMRRMLADEDMVDAPLEELRRLGDSELSRLRARFAATAHKIDPEHSPAEVYRALSREHPPAGQVIARVRVGLSSLRAFVIARHLATIPPAPLPIVRETPPYMRATTFAAMDTPGPLEKKDTRAYYYVTLPDPGWSARRRDQLLEFFSPPAISNTSVHEVYPGHYVQFLDARRNPDRVRALFYSGANAEGWAFYCEQMMLDEGLHAGHPKYRLAEIEMALLRVCRYLAALGMHTQGMTVAQAAEFFEKNAYMPRNNARMEALRGTQDPGYLRYELGKLMIMKLRADLKRRQGAKFNLGRFHDAFLAEGGLPVPLIRQEMLGPDAGPPL